MESINGIYIGDTVKQIIPSPYPCSGWDVEGEAVVIDVSVDGIRLEGRLGWHNADRFVTVHKSGIVPSADATDSGDDMKFDGGKSKAGTLYEYFPNAIEEVNKVSTFGCEKYERGSFIHVPNGYERYNDAFHRHLIAESKGETHDPESELLHAAHAAWGALCRLEFILRGKV